MLEPGGHEAVRSMFGKELRDGCLVCLGRGCGEGERNLTKAKFEHPVAATRLAIVVALWRCPAQKFDLAIVESEAAVDGGDLRFDRPFVRQQQARRAAFDDRRCYRGAINVRKRLCGEDDGRVLLPKRLQPFPELPRKILVIEGKPTFIDNKECRPAVETAPETDVAERKEALDNDIDDILDEIDDVLETNAEDFVKSFIQKGGE